jgi:hypothetical protein
MKGSYMDNNKAKEMFQNIYDFIRNNKQFTKVIWEDEEGERISEVEGILEDDVYDLWRMIEDLEEYIFPNP